MPITYNGSRTRIEGEISDQIIKVRLTRSERAKLEIVARDNQTTITDVLRDAVNEYVEDYGEQAIFRVAAHTRPLPWPSHAAPRADCEASGNALQRARVRTLNPGCSR